MSLEIVLVVAFIVIGVAVWMFFGGEPTVEESADAKPPASFGCKVCGARSPTFVAAHEHASADHSLAGHKIDESIEPE